MPDNIRPYEPLTPENAALILAGIQLPEIPKIACSCHFGRKHRAAHHYQTDQPHDQRGCRQHQ
jgi:hypothetical protein